MDHLLKSSQILAWLRSRPDDDSVDRFSRHQSVIILVFFGILIGIKQFLGTPIQCWCPAQFTDSHRDYANEICWANDKHYLPTSELILGEDVVDRNLLVTSYYKLIPIIFVLQALLTFAPCLFWRFLCKQSGINVSGILGASRDCAETSDIETKERAMRYIVDQMDSSFSQSMTSRKLNGYFLPSAFMIIKFLYFINALSQLIFIDKFLETDYILYGLYVLARLFIGQDWAFSSQFPDFPRAILCGFEMRHQSRVHNYVVQCSLTNNPLNEKIFIFLWFWFLVLLLATIAYGVLWFILLIYWQGNVQFVRKQIRAKDVSGGATVQHFSNNYLKSDGMLIVRLIDMNVGESVAGQVLRAVWESYSRERGVEQSKGEYGSKTNEPAYQSGPTIPFADPVAPGINPYYHVKSQS